MQSIVRSSSCPSTEPASCVSTELPTHFYSPPLPSPPPHLSLLVYPIIYSRAHPAANVSHLPRAHAPPVGRAATLTFPTARARRARPYHLHGSEVPLLAARLWRRTRKRALSAALVPAARGAPANTSPRAIHALSYEKLCGLAAGRPARFVRLSESHIAVDFCPCERWARKGSSARAPRALSAYLTC